MRDAVDEDAARFGELMGQVTNPFGDRATCLAAAQLDERGFREVVACWERALREEQARGGSRFRYAFAFGYRRGRGGVAEATMRREVAQALPGPRPRPTSVDETSSVGLALPREALPFAAPPSTKRPSPVPPPFTSGAEEPDPREDDSPSKQPEPRDDVNGTALLADAPWRPVLPFDFEDDDHE